MKYYICLMCGNPKNPLDECSYCGFVSDENGCMPKINKDERSASKAKNRVKPINTAKGKRKKTRSQTILVRCPLCHKAIQKKNRRKHIEAHHTNQSNEKASSKKTPPPQRKLTASEAKALKTALRESSISTNKEIADYLKNNPVKDNSGKFGTPQDKYRWGTYGRYSIDYDAWRKDS